MSRGKWLEFSLNPPTNQNPEATGIWWWATTITVFVDVFAVMMMMAPSSSWAIRKNQQTTQSVQAAAQQRGNLNSATTLVKTSNFYGAFRGIKRAINNLTIISI